MTPLRKIATSGFPTFLTDDAAGLSVYQAAAVTSTAQCRQSAAEIAPTRAIDDEVERRVGRDDQVAEVEVVEVRVAALVVSLGEEVIQQLVDVGRRLRHEEDHYDDEHHQGDVVPFTPVICTHLYPTTRATRFAVRLQQLAYYADVEEHQQTKRSQVDDQAVENVLVDDLVGLALDQFAATVLLSHPHRLRCACRDVRTVSRGVIDVMID